jgi:hypothetical protein
MKFKKKDTTIEENIELWMKDKLTACNNCKCLGYRKDFYEVQESEKIDSSTFYQNKKAQYKFEERHYWQSKSVSYCPKCKPEWDIKNEDDEKIEYLKNIKETHQVIKIVKK